MEKIRGILIHSAYTAAADGGDLLEGDVPEELHHVCEVVLVLAVAGARVRLEQEVPGGELEGHAGRAPDVCRGPVAGAEQHLQRAVLPGLDILRVVVVLNTKILFNISTEFLHKGVNS